MVFKVKYIKVFSFIVALAALFACNNTERKNNKYSRVNIAVQRANQIAEEDSAGMALSFLDSICASEKLEPAEMYKVYYVRYNLYKGKLKDIKKADLYVDSLLQLISAYPHEFDSSQMFTTFMQKGNVCYAKEQFQEAFKYYDLARDLAYYAKSPCQEFVYLYRIAMTYYGEEKYLESAHLFTEAYLLSVNCTNHDRDHVFRKQEILSNIGLAYSNAGITDSGILYFRRALEYIDVTKVNYPTEIFKWDEAISVVKGNMGTAFVKAQSYDSAAHYFIESIELSEQIKRNYKDRLYNILKLADLYLLQKDRKLAEQMLAKYDDVYKAEITGKEDDLRELALRKLGVYVRYYRSIGDVEKAFSYIREYDSLKEQKWKATNKVLVNNIDKGLDNADHEKHISLLNKDMQIRKQQNVILALAIILTVVVIVFIYRSLRRYSKKYERLEYVTEQITRESAAKEAQMQQKMRQDELNFMALIENTDDFLWSVDREFNLLAFNKAYKQYTYFLTGKYPEIGKPDPIKEYNPDGYSHLLAGYRTVLSGGQYNVVQKGMPVKGETPDIELRLNTLKDVEGNIIGVSCFRRDITEYVKMIDSLEDNYKRLKDIAWMQSHKIRGPLTTIMAILEYLESDDQDEQLRKVMFTNLRKKVEEMDAIIREIVDKTY